MNAEQRRERVRRFEEVCRERGLARTAQRRQILELVLHRKDHPTADQVYDDARRCLPHISRATVYRVLETLVELGLVAKVSSPGPVVRYDPMTGRHHHLVCTRCDVLIDVEEGRVDAEVSLPAKGTAGFKVQDYSIHYYGLCADCRRRQAASPSRGNAGAQLGRQRQKPAPAKGPPQRKGRRNA